MDSIRNHHDGRNYRPNFVNGHYVMDVDGYKGGKFSNLPVHGSGGVTMLDGIVAGGSVDLTTGPSPHLSQIILATNTGFLEDMALTVTLPLIGARVEYDTRASDRNLGAYWDVGTTRTINQQELSPFAVPEPSTLYLLGFGAVCGSVYVMGHKRRERRTATTA
jgi:PEP-CTERM motif